jgi:hypothetical protein
MVKMQYLKRQKVSDAPGVEVDHQQFFAVMKDIYMLMTQKKLLRAVILLSFVSAPFIPYNIFSVETNPQSMKKSIR